MGLQPILDLLLTVTGLLDLGLFFLVVGTLLGFFYWFFLRRILRARRIAHARMKRMIREAAERESGGEVP